MLILRSRATLVGEPTGIVTAGVANPDGHITLAEDWDFDVFFFADADSIVVQTTDEADAAADYPFHARLLLRTNIGS